MSERPLNPCRHLEILGVPLDLGGNRRGTDMGPSALRIAHLESQLRILDYEVTDRGDLPVPSREAIDPGPKHARYVEPIAEVCRALAQRVDTCLSERRFPLVVGGDHAIALGTVKGVTQHLERKHEKLGLLWFDAHADMNTPETSPSGNIHGMPLGVLLGTPSERFGALETFCHHIEPENVVLIGARDLDPREKDIVTASGISVFTMKEIDRFGISEVAEQALDIVTRNTAGIHLSLDLDGVDPKVAPGVGTPVAGGLTFRECHLLMELIADTRKLLSMEVVELNPILDLGNSTAEFAVGLMQSALGRQIL